MYPDVLQWTELIVQNNTVCEDLIQQEQPTSQVTGNMVCGGYENHLQRDTCQVRGKWQVLRGKWQVLRGKWQVLRV